MEENKRWTLQRNDIAGAITRGDIFYFLVDIIPRDELKVRVYTAFGIFSSTISMSDFLVDIVPGDKLRLEFTKLLVFFLVLYPCGISG